MVISWKNLIYLFLLSLLSLHLVLMTTVKVLQVTPLLPTTAIIPESLKIALLLIILIFRLGRRRIYNLLLLLLMVNLILLMSCLSAHISVFGLIIIVMRILITRILSIIFLRTILVIRLLMIPLPL